MTDPQSTLNIGVIGQTHLDAYAKFPNANIFAVADLEPNKLSGEAGAHGNIEGQAQGGFDLSAPHLRKYRDGLELIADPDIDIVDICVPTPGYLSVGLASLEAGARRRGPLAANRRDRGPERRHRPGRRSGVAGCLNRSVR